jgi:tetratricopeptide (TPR) repeat protein
MAFRLRNIFGARSAPNTPEGNSAKLHQAQSLIQDGRLDQAALTLRELLAVDAGHAEAWYRHGNVLKDLHQPHEALASYRRAIDLKPRYTAAHCNRGVVLLALGRPDEALSGFRQAIEIDPNDAIAHYNCAVAQQTLNQSDEALDSYSKAIELKPNYAEAQFSRARLHEESAHWLDALRDYDHALALRPDLTQAHFHRGNVLVQLKRWEDALASYDLAVSCDPENVVAHLHRGNVLRELRRWDGALESYNRAIALKPDQVDAYFNRGVLFEQRKQFPQALASFELAIAIRPDFAPAQYNRALVLLQTGDFDGGFSNYEWRWKNRETSFDPANYRGLAPIWSGRESLDKKSILVFSEQGLGDTLQFCRYIKLLAGHGAQVAFEVQPPLVDLLAHIEGASAVIPRGGVIPNCDFKCPLLSLPLAFKTTLDTIPSERKYLHVDAVTVAQWHARLGPRTRPRIGLVWSGNGLYPNDRQRSMSLATLVEYLPREFEYFCLQRDIRAPDRATLAANPFIADYSPDFMNTAALCECMDLVISVCTSVAHLAGALGRPLWVLLAYNADWRWLEDRDDSPWYPSARLYRQAAIGDWNGVAARVAEDLRRTFAAGRQFPAR